MCLFNKNSINSENRTHMMCVLFSDGTIFMCNNKLNLRSKTYVLLNI